MNDDSRFLRFARHWILPNTVILLFCLFLLVMTWGAALWQAERDRQVTTAEVLRDGDNYTRAFEEQVRQVLKTNDHYLMMLKKEFEEKQAVTPALTNLLAMISHDPVAVQVAVEDEKGNMLASLRPFTPGVNFADQPHFKAHVAADSHALFIGPPFTGRVSGQSSIPLSRRLNHADGSFAGIVYIAISPDYFAQFYRAMNFDENYVVRVLGADGIVRASNDEREVGSSQAKSTLFTYLPEKPAGSYRSIGQFVGRPLLINYRAMPDYPLALQVGVLEDTLLPMVQRRYAYLGAAAIISLCVILFTGRMILHARRQRRVEAYLQQNHEELTAAHEELVATEEELRGQYDEILRVNETVKRQNALLSSLHETALGLMSRLDITEVLAAIATRLAELAGTEHVYVFVINQEEKTAIRMIGKGIYASDVDFKRDSTQGMIGEVVRRKKTFMVEDYSTWANRNPGPIHDSIHANVQVPLINDGEVIGTLGMAFTEQSQHFGDSDVALIEEFAVVASVALDNARTVRELKESKDTIEAIFNAANDVIIVNDGDTGEILSVNRQASLLFGYSVEEIKAIGLAAIASPANVESALSRIRNTIIAGPQLYVRETADRAGNRLVLEIQSSPAVIHGKVRCLALMRDITGRKKMEEEIIQLQAQKQAMLDAIPDIIVGHNRKGDFLYYKPSKNSAFSSLAEAPVGKNAKDFFPPDYLPRVLEAIEQALLTGQHSYEAKLFTKGADTYVESRYVKVNEDEVLVIVRDITERYRMEERLEFLSLHDSLTGAYNRAYFEEEMRRLESRKHRGIGLFVGDVDGLKIINDTLGHRHGDQLLRQVAAILRTGLESPDFVARIGGDEFAVVLFEPTEAELESLEMRYQKAIADYNRDNPHLPLSLSVGWAADYTGDSVEQVIKEADHNMYRQKMHQSQSVRGAIVQTMMKALEARDFITEGHADRMQVMAEAMGRQLGLSQGALADLRLLAKFHDIGKVGIPDSILNKPGRLDDEERAVMQRHCEIGFRIARSSPDLAPIAEWVLKHQEWWDGHGYPLGLEGEEIPVECRILALVDAYDAMTNDRPYRQALTPEVAVAEIRRCSGTQFDPFLVELFLDLLHKGPVH
ncbi:MAG: diguanylate cyclase [Negativicutes bacterium]|nr:diguanylate cyclase [Negativicutes bacterium]